MYSVFLKILLSLFIFNQLSALESSAKTVLDNFKGSPCQVCKKYVKSFIKAKKTTSDVENADQEKPLGISRSENHFAEIQKQICSDLNKDALDCYTFNENFKGIVEKWHLDEQDSNDLFTYLCVVAVKVCCPEKYYGSDCLQCPDCSTNGRCDGDGDRSGNGTCLCDLGYVGTYCDQCDDKYYSAYQDAEKLICTKCHDACAGNCNGPGPGACHSCRNGYRKTDEGCADINECLYDKPCSHNKFCVNKEGTYICLRCDHSCHECTGDGPDMCISCAKDYTLYNGVCVDTMTLSRDSYVSLTRYLTYLGMCIATFIIFQKNVYIAGVIGIAVALYISTSEIMLKSKSSTQNQFVQNVFH